MSCLFALRVIGYKLDISDEEKDQTKTWALIFDTCDLWLMFSFL